jgi:hypothetical protein
MGGMKGQLEPGPSLLRNAVLLVFPSKGSLAWFTAQRQ